MQKVQYFFKLLLFLMVESTSTVIFITIESSAKNKNKNDMETRTYFYRVFTTLLKLILQFQSLRSSRFCVEYRALVDSGT